MLDSHPEPTARSTAEDDLRALLERARQGEAAAVPALRAALDQHPEVWDRYGDLASHAQRAWIDLISGPDLALAEALTRKAASLEANLSGPDPSPLESLLAGRIVACWLQTYQVDATQAQSGEVSLKQAEFTSKRQARAHKSFLMAIASLATIRRLLPADTAKRLSTRPGDHDPADIAGDERPSVSVGSIPVAEVENRLTDLTLHGPLVLFDRPAAEPNQDDGPGLPPGQRGRSAS